MYNFNEFLTTGWFVFFYFFKIGAKSIEILNWKKSHIFFIFQIKFFKNSKWIFTLNLRLVISHSKLNKAWLPIRMWWIEKLSFFLSHKITGYSRSLIFKHASKCIWFNGAKTTQFLIFFQFFKLNNSVAADAAPKS